MESWHELKKFSMNNNQCTARCASWHTNWIDDAVTAMIVLFYILISDSSDDKRHTRNLH